MRTLNQINFSSTANTFNKEVNMAFEKSLAPFQEALSPLGLTNTFQKMLEEPNNSQHLHQIMSNPQVQESPKLYLAIYNLWRVLSEYGRGKAYGANPVKASSDVSNYFFDQLPIPKDGVIVLDRFAVRNLTKMVERLLHIGSLRGEDFLPRVRIRVCDYFFLAQLKGLNRDKEMAQEFLSTASVLQEQFILGEGFIHESDIELGDQIAARLAPRVDTLTPDTPATRNFESSEKAACERLKKDFSQLVKGGTALLNFKGASSGTPLEVNSQNQMTPVVRKRKANKLILKAAGEFEGRVSIKPDQHHGFVSVYECCGGEDVWDLGMAHHFDHETHFMVMRDS